MRIAHGGGTAVRGGNGQVRIRAELDAGADLVDAVRAYIGLVMKIPEFDHEALRNAVLDLCLIALQRLVTERAGAGEIVLVRHDIRRRQRGRTGPDALQLA